MIGEVTVKVGDTPLTCVYEADETHLRVYKVLMFDMDITRLIEQLGVKDKIEPLVIEAIRI